MWLLPVILTEVFLLENINKNKVKSGVYYELLQQFTFLFWNSTMGSSEDMKSPKSAKVSPSKQVS